MPAVFMSNVASGLLTRAIWKMAMKDGTTTQLAFRSRASAGLTVQYDLTITNAQLRHDVLQH